MNHRHERIAYGALAASAFATVLWIAAPDMDAIRGTANHAAPSVLASTSPLCVTQVRDVAAAGKGLRSVALSLTTCPDIAPAKKAPQEKTLPPGKQDL